MRFFKTKDDRKIICSNNEDEIKDLLDRGFYECDNTGEELKPSAPKVDKKVNKTK